MSDNKMPVLLQFSCFTRWTRTYKICNTTCLPDDQSSFHTIFYFCSQMSNISLLCSNNNYDFLKLLLLNT